MLIKDYNGTYNISTDAISVIFYPLLKSRDRKALLLVGMAWTSIQRL